MSGRPFPHPLLRSSGRSYAILEMWPWRSAAETPAPYVELARSGEVERRAAGAHELLGERCVVYPRGCKVTGARRRQGLCAIGAMSCGGVALPRTSARRTAFAAGALPSAPQPSKS